MYENYKFTVYIYDTARTHILGVDTSELYIGDKYISEINLTMDVHSLSEIPENDLPYVVLIVPFDTKIPVRTISYKGKK